MCLSYIEFKDDVYLPMITQIEFSQWGQCKWRWNGSINIEVDDDIVNADQLKAGIRVKVIGEVDTHCYKPTDIDVVQLEIFP